MYNRIVFNVRHGLKLQDVLPDVTKMILTSQSLAEHFVDVAHETIGSYVILHEFRETRFVDKACGESFAEVSFECCAVVKEELDSEVEDDDLYSIIDEGEKLKRVGQWIEGQEASTNMEEPEALGDVVSEDGLLEDEHVDVEAETERSSNESGIFAGHCVTMEEEEEVEGQRTAEVEMPAIVENCVSSVESICDEPFEEGHMPASLIVGDYNLWDVDDCASDGYGYDDNGDSGNVDMSTVGEPAENIEEVAEPFEFSDQTREDTDPFIMEGVVETLRDIVLNVAEGAVHCRSPSEATARAFDEENEDPLYPTNPTVIDVDGPSDGSSDEHMLSSVSSVPYSVDEASDSASHHGVGQQDDRDNVDMVESGMGITCDDGLPEENSMNDPACAPGNSLSCSMSRSVEHGENSDLNSNNSNDRHHASEDDKGDFELDIGIKPDPGDGRVWYSQGRLCFHPRKCEMCTATKCSHLSTAIRHLLSHLKKDGSKSSIFSCLHCKYKTNRHDCIIRHFKALKHKEFDPPAVNVNYEEDWSPETVQLLCSLAVKCFPDISQYLTKGVERARQLAELRKEKKVEKVKKERKTKQRRVPEAEGKSVEPDSSV